MPSQTVQSTRAGFPTDYVRFFKDIKKNNTKEWFTANKARYETSVKAPSLAFIRDVGPALSAISKQVVADPRPVGGSMFRIHRDIRFSKDKSPYKTHVGIHFSNRDSTDECRLPGFYLHIEPGDSSVWAGVWNPDPVRLRKVRDAIASNPAAWRKLVAGKERHGEALKRVPQGYDPLHPAADELKWKDYIAGISVSDAEVTSSEFPKTFVATCKQLALVNAFLCKAMDEKW